MSVVSLTWPNCAAVLTSFSKSSKAEQLCLRYAQSVRPQQHWIFGVVDEQRAGMRPIMDSRSSSAGSAAMVVRLNTLYKQERRVCVALYLYHTCDWNEEWTDRSFVLW